MQGPRPGLEPALVRELDPTIWQSQINKYFLKTTNNKRNQENQDKWCLILDDIWGEYSSAPLSVGNAFQDPHLMPETKVLNTIDTMFFPYTYIHT